MTSTIKVNNIQNQCGGAVVTKCGATTTISGSVVKADDIQAADGGNLINQCGTTITLGASGDTINLAAGASQSGFGRTGTVDWQTGSIKTSDFTAVNGEGYFVNTTGGAVIATLPASPSAGDIVAIADYAGTAATNNITINRNGSLFESGTSNGTILTNRQVATVVYVDGTQGWIVVNSNDQSFIAPAYVAASGGNSTATVGNYKIHTFTSPGTFTVTCAGNSAGNQDIDYLVVAGGGSGIGGGGGAGGFRESRNPNNAPAWTASPLATTTSLNLPATGYPIIVGAGGATASGSNSIFSTITSAGGGLGAARYLQGSNGGSGGGTGQDDGLPGGTGNTPPVSPPQGNPGGFAPPGGYGGGSGGGGATAAGSNGGGPGNPAPGGNGGAGATTTISNSSTTYAGGGGGGANTQSSGTGGSGGSGGGGGGGGPNNSEGTCGSANTGGGGGGAEFCAALPGGSRNGGSGIVIIRYKFQ